MNIAISGLRHRQFLEGNLTVLLLVRMLVAVLCLTGIGVLFSVYISQTNLVTEAFSELSLQEEKVGPFTPAELGDLSHRACVLNSGINNVQSFLQPLGNTLSGGGWCGNYVRVFIIFAEQEGYPAHKFHIQSGGRSHTLAEVYYEGKWRIIDPFFNQIFQLPSGEMATFEDLRRDLSLVSNPTQGKLNDPRLDRIYRSYQPVFPALYRDAPDFVPGLGRSAIYHNAFVTLSYPLSLFYEGGRRPLLPAWLDRPELLGIYALSIVLLITVAPTGIRLGNKMRRHRRADESGRSIDSP